MIVGAFLCVGCAGAPAGTSVGSSSPPPEEGLTSGEQVGSRGLVLGAESEAGLNGAEPTSDEHDESYAELSKESEQGGVKVADDGGVWAPPELSTALLGPRRYGNYVLPETPLPDTISPRQDLSTWGWQRVGGRSKSADYFWTGIKVPDFVPIHIEGIDILNFLVVAEDGGAVGMYRGTCRYPDDCPVFIYFSPRGKRIWIVGARTFFTSRGSREVRGADFKDGIVYFTDACIGYPKKLGRDCSSVFAVRGATGELVWRSPPVVSNNQLYLTEHGIITVYGFTSNPDYLYLLDTGTGKVKQRLSVHGSPSYFIKKADGNFWLETNHACYEVSLSAGGRMSRKMVACP